MNTITKFLCRVVSLLGFACSGFCIWYIATVASSILGPTPHKDSPSGFTGWYVGLSCVSAIIAVGVLLGSFELARLHVRGARLLTLCSFSPLPVAMVVGMSWLSPMGESIAAASGVGLGGLMPMLLSLLPLWSGLLWLYAFRQCQPAP